MHYLNPEANQQSRHEEFVTLLTASRGKLQGYLMSLLGRWHEAQDALQRSSLLMWQKFEAFDSGSDFVAWASTIYFYKAKKFSAPRSTLTIPI
jgi:RNA polymerase sigma-70 factor, ECF subfamily